MFLTTVSRVNGQAACHLPNGQPAPAYFNLAVVMNQSYLDQFPNQMAARDYAESKIKAGIQILQTQISNN